MTPGRGLSDPEVDDPGDPTELTDWGDWGMERGDGGSDISEHSDSAP